MLLKPLSEEILMDINSMSMICLYKDQKYVLEKNYKEKRFVCV